jgi:hypothetical protein
MSIARAVCLYSLARSPDASGVVSRSERMVLHVVSKSARAAVIAEDGENFSLDAATNH